MRGSGHYFWVIVFVALAGCQHQRVGIQSRGETLRLVAVPDPVVVEADEAELPLGGEGRRDLEDELRRAEVRLVEVTERWEVIESTGLLSLRTPSPSSAAYANKMMAVAQLNVIRLEAEGPSEMLDRNRAMVQDMENVGWMEETIMEAERDLEVQTALVEKLKAELAAFSG